VVGPVLYRDDFDGSLDRWRAELEKGGRVEASAGKMVIDVPGGCSVWFESMLSGPVMIEYDATVIGRNGPNDRVSDLNCFWMARDARHADDLFAVERSGRFSEYNQLKCYYVGYGGNSNSTTRFRRYIGDAQRRPLLPAHDLSDKSYMIQANRTMKVRCIAAEGRIEYWRDGERVFSYDDPQPYTSGWFAFRTVMSHIEFDNFRVYRMAPKP
jgi:hypothetical protein